MISQSLQASEFSAPPPRWAVGVSLLLIVIVTSILTHVLSDASAGGTVHAGRAIPARSL